MHRSTHKTSDGRIGSSRLRRWLWSGAVMAVLTAPMGTVDSAQQGPSIDKPYLMPEANRLPDKNEQMRMQEQKAKKQNFEVANAERRKQIEADTAKLLQLANELKTEIDKTDKDTLSLNVMRKAESIERLAKGVREKMKLTIGAS